MVVQLLTGAARVGCRQGIIQGTTTQQIRATATGYRNGVGIAGEAVTVTINDGRDNVVEAASVPAYTEITVVVTVRVAEVNSLPRFLHHNQSLSGQWAMRRE